MAGVGTLVLYSRGFSRGLVNLYQEAHLDPGAVIVEYDTWPQLAAALSRYTSIDRLVILGHTAPGVLLFGYNPRTHQVKEAVPLDQAVTRLNALRSRPRIRIVDFAGCNTGLDLGRVLQFGLAVGATEVLATNHFHEFKGIGLAGGPRGPDLERKYLNLRDYITTPDVGKLVDQSKKRPVSKTVLLEWYVATAAEADLDLPTDTNLHSKENTDVFKPGGAADPQTITSPAELKNLQADFALFDYREPIRRLTSITLFLDGFRTPADAGSPEGGTPPRPDAGRPDAGSPQRPPTGRPDAGRPDAGRPDAGSPQRPPTGRPGARGRRLPADDPAVRAVPGPVPGRPGPEGRERRPGALDQRDWAIAEEVFRRGGSVSDAMDVLVTRVLDQGSTPAQRWLRQPPEPRRAAAGAAGPPRFTLEDRGLLDGADPEQRQRSRLDKLEAARPLVQERFDAYLAATAVDFLALRSASVRESFEPIREAPYADPYASRLEKYRAMRGAYYRAGWACVQRDVLDLIVPATFFGTPVKGGVHREMADVLRSAEKKVRDGYPKLAAAQQAAGFVIGGFVPRFQAGSAQLSNHALGLAIDIDPSWNPQLKSAEARAALARATGDDIGRSLVPVSSVEIATKLYTRVAAMSARLRDWLHLWLPQYQQLTRLRADAARDQKGKEKVASIDRQIRSDKDLSAVATLVREYSLPTVQSWAAYGIMTIPPQVIQAFLDAGRPHGARWGGQYDNTKDLMHLELLRLVRDDSLARPGRSGLRRAVPGFDDLRRGDPPPPAACGPPR